jgi:hypothetical protein
MPLSKLYDEALVYASELHRDQVRKGSGVDQYEASLYGVEEAFGGRSSAPFELQHVRRKSLRAGRSRYGTLLRDRHEDRSAAAHP